MFIPTLSFEVFDSASETATEFLIKNTFENQEKVFAHPHTRNLRFTKTFDFQFEREMRMPIEMMDIQVQLSVLNQLAEMGELK